MARGDISDSGLGIKAVEESAESHLDANGLLLD
jgi:hypothetical protein